MNIIFKYLCLVFLVLISFSGCRKSPLNESYLSNNSFLYTVSSTDEQSESTMLSSDTSESNDVFSIDNIIENGGATSAEPQESTVKAPMRAYLYKNGKKYLLEDEEFTLKIAQKIESRFANIDIIPAASLYVSPDLIWPIKDSETAIEFFYEDEILLNGKSLFGKNARSILMPITGEQNDFIFDGDGEGVYFPGPVHSALNSSFDDIIKSVKIETLKEIPSIRITLPEKAFLYKDGKKYKIINEEQVLNILKAIEENFYWLGLNARQAKIKVLEQNFSEAEILNSFKNTNIGIEFYYGEQEILLNGNKAFDENVKGIFVPVSAGEKFYIYTCEVEGKYSLEYYSQYNGDIEHLIDSLLTEPIEF